ncbi:MBL fold metallo-hydrolase [Rhodocytophaga aerolata]|uniref:MBL fold metallo-hydrolase n=1 Tax=Rhodocytophaga aerolata TaxID=455078 RepID=A0ABT8R2D1_9BACT|nr:MBL fold metallo-hydrolase [Rhodocytophaga aerolata]MDO1446266.1 MBL fold metallo-hydrolase [Rhodocytophaga aerolata]
MIRTIFLFCFTILISSAIAQRSSADQISTNKGTLTIQPILHGSAVLTWDNKTIYIDPYGGAEAYTGIAAPDLILITDIHGDHMDLKTLESIDISKAKMVVPQAVAEQLPEKYKSNLVIVANGNKTEQAGISITAIPMYNLPETADSRHPKGRGNGYVLTIGGKNVYFSGDTEDIPEMRSLKNIDVAFVCMNLPFTMDVNQAAEAVLAFKPKLVYPYHYRGQNGLSDTEAFKKAVTTGNSKIEVKLKNWYPGT